MYGTAQIVQTHVAEYGSLNQVRDWSSEQSISARKSPLLHKLPGTGSQVADGIHRKLAARICLNIPDDLNGELRVFKGLSQDKTLQIRKDCDGPDIRL